MDEEDRRGGDEFERKIAVADAVDAVFRNAREAEQPGNIAAIDRQRRARERAGAEREDVDALQAIAHALGVALEHLGVREQMVREEHRLRALEMRVAGHDDVDMALRLPRELALEARSEERRVGKERRSR